MTTFVPPSFETGELELRCDAGEVTIYGTPQGLAKLAELCLKLAQLPESKQTKHVHLEDYQFLTSNSLPGAAAVFHKPTGEPK